jgi:hypothetical protein
MTLPKDRKELKTYEAKSFLLLLSASIQRKMAHISETVSAFITKD